MIYTDVLWVLSYMHLWSNLKDSKFFIKLLRHFLNFGYEAQMRVLFFGATDSSLNLVWTCCCGIAMRSCVGLWLNVLDAAWDSPQIWMAGRWTLMAQVCVGQGSSEPRHIPIGFCLIFDFNHKYQAAAVLRLIAGVHRWVMRLKIQNKVKHFQSCWVWM